MKVLGIDGGLDGTFSAAIAIDGRPETDVTLPGNTALERGLEALAQLLDRAGVTGSDLDRVAVGIGPGSFTGVRIAISYAKSLAQGWRRPLVGVGSFDAIEAGSPAHEPLLTVVRGRTGVVSVRLHRNGDDRRWSGYVRDVLEHVGSGSGKLYVAGDIQDVLSGLAERGFSVEPVQRAYTPAARAVAVIGGERAPALSSHEVRADYGELPAARVPDVPGTRQTP